MNKFLKKIISCLSLFCLCLSCSCNVFATKGLKIVFVGNYASGKTALRAILSDNEFDFTNRTPTTHSDYYSYPFRYHNENIMCDLVDTSGNKKLKNTIITDRLDKANIAVITIDASDDAEQGYQDLIEQTLGEWIRIIRQIRPNVFVLLAITKTDRIGSRKKEEIIRRAEGLKSWHSRLDYVITSATKKTGIDEFWKKVVDIIDSENLYSSLPQWQNPTTINDGLKWYQDCTIV